MGQKVNPTAYRLGLYGNWKSKWFAKGKDMANYVLEDYKIRELIKQVSGPQAGISEIIIERGIGALTIFIYSARPGILIGRSGKQLEKLREDLTKMLKKKFKLEIVEIKKADSNAQVVAQNIGIQISKRMPFRRVAKQTLQKVIATGVAGARITISGRLDGAEISRDETFSSGSIPLTTLRKDIQFATYHAKTTYGVIGIKVWINCGDKII
ncbi:MAG: 30S ribosomal protein S3 [Candidatus Berkelbacteria bacterium]|nr:30S ribosomal protein S3 [Candidatus Berkelbacteria bacterium]